MRGLQTQTRSGGAKPLYNFEVDVYDSHAYEDILSFAPIFAPALKKILPSKTDESELEVSCLKSYIGKGELQSLKSE